MGEVLRGGQNEATRSLRDKITDKEQRTKQSQTQRTRTNNNNMNKEQNEEQRKQVQETKPKTEDKTNHEEHRTIIKNNVESKQQAQEE